LTEDASVADRGIVPDELLTVAADFRNGKLRLAICTLVRCGAFGASGRTISALKASSSP
jgi:hypothetical protein